MQFDLGYFYLDNQNNAIYELSTKRQNAHQFLQELYKKMQSKSELTFSENPNISTLVNRVVSGYNRQLGLLQRIWESFLSIFSFFKIHLSKTQQIYHFAKEIEKSSLARKDDPAYDFRQDLLREIKDHPSRVLTEERILSLDLVDLSEIVLQSYDDPKYPRKLLELAVKLRDSGKREISKSLLRSFPIYEAVYHWVDSSYQPLLFNLMVDYVVVGKPGEVRELIQLIDKCPKILENELASVLRRCSVRFIDELITALKIANPSKMSIFIHAIAQVAPGAVQETLSRMNRYDDLMRDSYLLSTFFETEGLQQVGVDCFKAIFDRVVKEESCELAEQILNQRVYRDLPDEVTQLQREALRQLIDALTKKGRQQDAEKMKELLSQFEYSIDDTDY